MARWSQIAETIADRIASGDLAPGAHLPTEAELAAAEGVSRGTVNRAYSALRAQGLIISRTKGGTIVAGAPVRLHLSRYGAVVDPDRERSHLGPWETACADQGIDGRMEVLGVSQTRLDRTAASLLDRQESEAAVRRDRRMWAGLNLVGLQTSWIPMGIAEGTPLAGAEKIVGGLYAELTRQGRRPATVSESVEARIATPAEREALDLPRAAVVHDLWRTTRDATGTPVEALRVLLAADAVTLHYDRLPIGP